MAETITDRVRSVGDGLILAFPVAETEPAGQEIDTVRLYFFRIASETRFYQVYSSLGDITSGSTTPTNGYGYLGDTGVDSGSDIFRLSTDDWHLMHFGFAPAHSDLRVYTAVSPDASGNPAQDRTGQGENITPGTDSRGFFGREHIGSTQDPPTITERVSFRNDDDGEFLQWAFHNNGSATLSGSQLNLHFAGRGYKVQPVTNPAVQSEMLKSALTEKDDTVDTIVHQVGGIGRYTLGTEEPDQWRAVRDTTPAFTEVLDASQIGPPWDGNQGRA